MEPMRVMVLLKAKASLEDEALPAAKHVAAMGKFHDELVKAGVMLAAGVLDSSAKGKRVVFADAGAERRAQVRVIDGPFGATEGLVAGYWIWQVKSIDEALEWVRRCPATFGQDVELELRPVRNGVLQA